MDYQVAFVVLQIVFIFILGWFVRLLIIFSKDLTELTGRVSKNEKNHEVCAAIRQEKEHSVSQALARIEVKLDSITEIRTRS